MFDVLFSPWRLSAFLEANTPALIHCLYIHLLRWVTHLPAPAVQAALCQQPGSLAQTQSSRWWLPWAGRRDRAKRDGRGRVHRLDTRTWQTKGWRRLSGRRRRAGAPQTSRTAALPGSENRAEVQGWKRERSTSFTTWRKSNCTTFPPLKVKPMTWGQRYRFISEYSKKAFELNAITPKYTRLFLALLSGFNKWDESFNDFTRSPPVIKCGMINELSHVSYCHSTRKMLLLGYFSSGPCS